MIELIHDCIQLVPQRRKTALELLANPWWKQYDTIEVNRKEEDLKIEFT